MSEQSRYFTDHAHYLSKHGNYLTEHGCYLSEHGHYLSEHGDYFSDNGNYFSGQRLDFSGYGRYLGKYCCDLSKKWLIFLFKENIILFDSITALRMRCSAGIQADLKAVLSVFPSLILTKSSHRSHGP